MSDQVCFALTAVQQWHGELAVSGGPGFPFGVPIPTFTDHIAYDIPIATLKGFADAVDKQAWFVFATNSLDTTIKNALTLVVDDQYYYLPTINPPNVAGFGVSTVVEANTRDFFSKQWKVWDLEHQYWEAWKIAVQTQAEIVTQVEYTSLPVFDEETVITLPALSVLSYTGMNPVQWAYNSTAAWAFRSMIRSVSVEFKITQALVDSGLFPRFDQRLDQLITYQCVDSGISELTTFYPFPVPTCASILNNDGVFDAAIYNRYEDFKLAMPGCFTANPNAQIERFEFSFAGCELLGTPMAFYNCYIASYKRLGAPDPTEATVFGGDLYLRIWYRGPLEISSNNLIYVYLIFTPQFWNYYLTNNPLNTVFPASAAEITQAWINHLVAALNTIPSRIFDGHAIIQYTASTLYGSISTSGWEVYTLSPQQYMVALACTDYPGAPGQLCVRITPANVITSYTIEERRDVTFNFNAIRDCQETQLGKCVISGHGQYDLLGNFSVIDSTPEAANITTYCDIPSPPPGPKIVKCLDKPVVIDGNDLPGPTPVPDTIPPLRTLPTSILLRTGAIAPIYPTFVGAYVYDLHLKKWGKLKQDYKQIFDFAPINSDTSQVYPYEIFGISGALFNSSGKIKLFDEQPTDSKIIYGKVGLFRFGKTSAETVITEHKLPFTGTITLKGSLNGKHIEPELVVSSSYTGEILTISNYSLGASWFLIEISGIYDLSYLEFRGLRLGRR